MSIAGAQQGFQPSRVLEKMNLEREAFAAEGGKKIKIKIELNLKKKKKKTNTTQSGISLPKPNQTKKENKIGKQKD